MWWVPTLASARETAVAAGASLQDRIAAVDVLVAYGELDSADRLMASIGDAPKGAAPMMERLRIVSAALRAFEIPRRITASDPLLERLNGSDELVDSGPGSGSGTILVFTEITRRFWLSLPVLHQFLMPLGRRVVYLRDMRSAMFLGGLRSVGGDYSAMLGHLRELLKQQGPVDVLACSSGGYIGLRAASDLDARGYLGFGVRTDLSPPSRLMLGGYVEALGERPEHAEMLFDLRPYLETRPRPERIVLFSGSANRIDLAQAEHLRGIPRVSLHCLDSGTHNIVQQLVVENRFAEVLREHLS